MVATFNGKLLCKDASGTLLARIATQDAADVIIANNTPISEWQDGQAIGWRPVASLKNEDRSAIDVSTQTMLIVDAPDIDDWAINVELSFISA